MSWDYAIEYIQKQRFVRTSEQTTGDTSVVTMHATPEARPAGGSDLVIVLDIYCDGDGKPQSGQLRSI